MKRVDGSNITLTIGQRVKSGTLEFLQLLPTEIAQALIHSLYGIANNSSTVYVLYGCVNSTPGGSTFTISAGAVYYQGTIYLSPAVTFTTTTGVPVANIVTTPTTDAQHDPTKLTTGASVNVHLEDTMEIAEAVTGSGAADYSAYRFLTSNGWQSFTPVITASVGSYTTIGAAMKYNKKGDFAIVNFEINLSGGSASNGAIIVSLPFTLSSVTPAISVCASSGEIDETLMVQPVASGTTMHLVRLDGSNFPVFSGATLLLGQIILPI